MICYTTGASALSDIYAQARGKVLNISQVQVCATWLRSATSVFILGHVNFDSGRWKQHKNN